MGGLLAASWGAGMRRVRGTSPAHVVRLDDSTPPPPAGGADVSIVQNGSSVVVTLVGSVDRADSLTLASHLAGLVTGGSEHVVVDVERAHPAGRVMDALSIASPILERYGGRIALVPPKGEMLSASVQLTANGLVGWISVYDSVAEATRAIARPHARP